VGLNELQDLYPGLDPWLLPVGGQLTLPTQWVLPDSLAAGIVVNTAELRLYYFAGNGAGVMTFPVAIGDKDAATPTGVFSASTKQLQPVWNVPPSLLYKYGARAFPLGPDNPLGDHWLGLGHTRYGIHGSDMPWSVGRLVTHGCIRLYPEDMAWLYDRISIGTPVRIIYEPVKIGVLSNRIFVEVHPDIYSKTPGLVTYGMTRLARLKFASQVDIGKYYRALKACSGLPVDVTCAPSHQGHGAGKHVPSK
jgi:L,D-transpeptidase ErfK/SrfK